MSNEPDDDYGQGRSMKKMNGQSKAMSILFLVILAFAALYIVAALLGIPKMWH